MRAAAAEIDITPPLPCEKPGWIVKILATRVDDPLFAHVLVLEDDQARRLAIISLDVLSVRWPMAERIRDAAEKLNIPRDDVLVAATHTHTGPPVSAPGLATKDEAYIAELVGKVGVALAAAVHALRPARLSIGFGIESRVNFIRRCVMTDGTVKTHPQPGPDIRCPESVIDPQVAVIRVTDDGDKPLAVVTNFALHPVHHGGEPVISAGWPGVMYRQIKNNLGDDVTTLFLNGAQGDVHHQNPLDANYVDTKQRVGQAVAETVGATLPKCERIEQPKFFALRRTIKIPIRDIDGPLGEHFKFRQRFAPDAVYESLIAKLRRKRSLRDYVLAEVQCLGLDHRTALVTLPCEPFSAIGLDIKMRSPIPRTLVVGLANGMVGYVPTERAFERGGYETTLSMGSKLDPSAARALTETALALLSQTPEERE